MYHAKGVADPSGDELAQIKANTAQALRGTASAFLLDPRSASPSSRRCPWKDPASEFCWPPNRAERGTINGEPRTHRDPALNAHWVRDSGATALKFLVQLRADRRAAPAEPDTTAGYWTSSAAWWPTADCLASPQ